MCPSMSENCSERVTNKTSSQSRKIDSETDDTTADDTTRGETGSVVGGVADREEAKWASILY